MAKPDAPAPMMQYLSLLAESAMNSQHPMGSTVLKL
jgi:hypothetical protein